MSNIITWSCPRCSFENHPDLLICEICEYSCVDNIIKDKVTSTVTTTTKIEEEYKDNDRFIKKYTCDNATDGISILIQSEITKVNSNSQLSYPYCLHISQKGQIFGSSWSCGYRNIQMLCSSLLQISLYKNALLSNKGDTFCLHGIPSINEIQYVLTKAWQEGFDPEGAAYFQNKLIHSSKWIGTTECAVFFRYFGIHANIVDFNTNNNITTSNISNININHTNNKSNTITDNNQNNHKCNGNAGIKRLWSNELDIDTLDTDKSNSSNSISTTTNVTTSTTTTITSTTATTIVDMKQIDLVNRLFNWVERYYNERQQQHYTTTSSSSSSAIGGNNRAIAPPLYFQHQGHSRTIIGFYRHAKNADLNGLIIFDPSSLGTDIQKSLDTNFNQWSRKLIKTKKYFKHKSYQILYISSENKLMSIYEYEASKLLIGQKDYEMIR